MKRYKICKSINDVREDGICSGCYDNRMAHSFGLSYGNYVALYGCNLLRCAAQSASRKRCPVCGRPINPTAPKNAVFCSKVCSAEAKDMAVKSYRRKGS